MESDSETIMSSYVEAQIDNTIQWIRSYTDSPELIETVNPPDEERMYTSRLAATMPAPDEHHAYDDEFIDTGISSNATHRHTFEIMRSVFSPIPEQTYTAAIPHPITPLTRKPSKLSKKRPASSSSSPSPSNSRHKFGPLDLSNLKYHRKSRKIGWVKSPKPTNLGFMDADYSTFYREEIYSA